MTEVVRFAGVACAYVVCFWLSVVGLPALSVGLVYSGTDYASLLFLPHGVRVIAAWLYGWRSVLYLAPPSYATHFWRLDGEVISWAVFFMPFVGMACVAATFALVARLGADLRLRPGYLPPWKDVLLVGALASGVNAVATNLLAKNTTYTMQFYLLGDVLGMLTVFVVLMLSFKYARRFGF
jgi:hypothetical protein